MTSTSAMPPEIADSDAESDVIAEDRPSQRRHAVEPSIQQPHDGAAAATVSPPNIDFDDFLDLTQRSSELTPNQTGQLGPGTGSTEKIIRELENGSAFIGSFLDPLPPNSFNGIAMDTVQAAENASKKKRGASAIDSRYTPAEVREQSKPKRAKTYGSKSTNLSTDVYDLFASLGSAQSQTNATWSEAHLSTHAVPSQVTRLRDQSMASTANNFSTTTSSIGGYQVHETDHRDSGYGLEVDVNPFADPSQASGHTVEPGRADNSNTAREFTDTANAHNDNLSQDLQNEMIIPHGKEHSTRETQPPATESIADVVESSIEVVPLAPPPKRRKTDMAGSRATASPAPAVARRAASVSVESASVASDKAQPKKRGRKPKSKAISEEMIASGDDTADIAVRANTPATGSSRRRRPTMDSSSQLSHTSDPVSNTKHKRKKSKEVEDKPPESSPVKNPSSEVHLSDEAWIGLPKEQYVPRPSRRRSKLLVEEDIAQHAIQLQGPSKEIPEQFTRPPTPEPLSGAEALPLKPSQSVGKAKGKKSKVKRAKTSAAALLKKSEPMISDGEDDVVWMEEQPTKVKLDLPPDLNAKKEEETKAATSPNHQEEEEDENYIVAPNDARPLITIELPALPQGNTMTKDKSEPKKRGRKPKMPVIEPDAEKVEPQPAMEEPLTTEEAHNSRQPLAPKDANIVQQPLPGVESPQSKLVTAPNTTPTNPSETLSPTKAPTTHSPISPSPSFNSLNRYRVGLSKRSKIPSLLRKIDKDKPPPTKTSVKVKVLKIKGINDGGDYGGDGEGDGGDGKAWNGVLRDKEGRLVEWDF